MPFTSISILFALFFSLCLLFVIGVLFFSSLFTLLTHTWRFFSLFLFNMLFFSMHTFMDQYFLLLFILFADFWMNLTNNKKQQRQYKIYAIYMSHIFSDWTLTKAMKRHIDNSVMFSVFIFAHIHTHTHTPARALNRFMQSEWVLMAFFGRRKKGTRHDFNGCYRRVCCHQFASFSCFFPNKILARSFSGKNSYQINFVFLKRCTKKQRSCKNSATQPVTQFVCFRTMFIFQVSRIYFMFGISNVLLDVLHQAVKSVAWAQPVFFL